MSGRGVGRDSVLAGAHSWVKGQGGGGLEGARGARHRINDEGRATLGCWVCTAGCEDSGIMDVAENRRHLFREGWGRVRRALWRSTREEFLWAVLEGPVRSARREVRRGEEAGSRCVCVCRRGAGRDRIADASDVRGGGACMYSAVLCLARPADSRRRPSAIMGAAARAGGRRRCATGWDEGPGDAGLRLVLGMRAVCEGAAAGAPSRRPGALTWRPGPGRWGG